MIQAYGRKRFKSSDSSSKVEACKFPEKATGYQRVFATQPAGERPRRRHRPPRPQTGRASGGGGGRSTFGDPTLAPLVS